MSDRTRWDPDPEAIADRTPAACPFCGHDGVFDGRGSVPDERTIKRAGVTTTYETQWSEFHCPECNGYFQLLDEATKIDQDSDVILADSGDHDA